MTDASNEAVEAEVAEAPEEEVALQTVDNIVSPLRYTPDPCSTCH
ncbi:hypothetical protein SEA_THUNDERCLAP_44 [Arthrobacter phage Thunderclap]|uniref:Uncharacterized protein n=10 Tax=Amigovirus amigo TaxID=1982100 RepID=A0A0U4KQU0_9CAUD|nr:hypothetical protein FDH66_gp59 [Arthrobacter phage Amigo]ALY08489.1 hypothetical protein ANANSI_44 [Arthrobacter phage Anansi]ALY09103.1 hypothetical protein GORGEOUS_44 [Arthrobacter phage Gorgeous]ALY10120.1 hypothetical protein RINGS_43 [Arthrobacter phage Rings]ALY10384.1 hypothetical protein SORJUANA_44 [Arthrobacter phage SorJuana]QFG08338.1 hypothetical protein SEA_YEEZUS_43 [Arthrobacter phage Yeezus]QFG13386.1 hypothetical protein SEA_ICHOR_43 [Arthrobacter phage Ichor]QFG13904.